MEQVEEDYFCKIERSRYEVVYKRKKSGGGKTIANVEVDNDESWEEAYWGRGSRRED